MENYIDIQEKIDPSVRYPLIEQFPKPTIAFLEISDNSIASRLPGKPLEIRISVKHDYIAITDKWGTGMGPERLEKFLTWGSGERSSIFRFHGQGGKAALAHLAHNFVLYSTPAGEKVTYCTAVQDWPKNLDQLRTVRFQIREAMFDFPTVTFQLSGLRKTIGPAELKRCLAETYRPLLAHDMVRIWVNGSKIVPVDIPYIERCAFSETSPFGLIEGWVGLKPEGSPTRGGIRCYAQGRLISKREFFGLDEPSVDFEHIVGEVELPFVPVITLKTEFDQASKEWLAACQVVKPKLKPFARRVFPVEKKLKDFDKEIPTLKKKILEIFRLGDETFGPGGRKSPTEAKERRPSERREHRMSLNKPSTPRPPGAVGATRRLGDFEFAELNENIRSYYDKEKGIILVNRNFPACLTAWRLYKQDQRPLFGHVVETLALEWYTRDGTPPAEIKERVNHLLKIAHER